MKPSRQRRRPLLEVLEDRTLPAVRLIVPLELPADEVTTFHSITRACVVAGLAAGDVIQIEPGSSPAGLLDGNVPNLANITVQGDPAFAVSELPEVVLDNAVTIGAARAGFTWKHLGLRAKGTLTYTANGTITDCQFADDVLGTGLSFNGTTAANLLNSRVFTLNGGAPTDATMEVTTAAGAANHIEGNDFHNETTATVTPLLIYQGANTVADVVRDNHFTANSSGTTPIVSFEGGASGVTFQKNIVAGAFAATIGVRVLQGSQNVRLLGNTITLTGVATPRCVLVDAGAAGTTNVTIARNQLNTNGGGIGVDFAGTTGTLQAKVEGNDFHGNMIGVRVGATSVTNIDLGGGTQGSAGANNFRGFTMSATAASGAIVATSPSGQTLVANSNLFNNAAITTPDDVFFDFNDDVTRANVQASGSLSTNASFVQALYVHFLHRVGNLANPMDAGGWVTALGSGTPASAVANGIVRSAEALGLQVDALYRQFLGRAADPMGRGNAVAALQMGVTVEQLIAGLVASGEYALRYGSDTAFAQSLYYKLLNRVPASAELAAMRAAVPTLGRAGVANIFLGSPEYRGLQVRRLFSELLHRAAAAGEVNAFVGSGADVLTLTAVIAGSSEFVTNG